MLVTLRGTGDGDVRDPVRETAHEFTVVVRVAGREIECAIRADRADRTGRNTELAFQARVVINRLIAHRYFGVHERRSEQDEVAEPGMDDIAMYAHMTET